MTPPSAAGPDEIDAYYEDAEDEYDPDDYISYAIKWSADGAKTIDEVCACLQGLIESLRENERDGWELMDQVDGGMFTLDLTDEALARGVLRPSEIARQQEAAAATAQASQAAGTGSDPIENPSP